MVKKLLLISLFFLIGIEVLAQGFNSVNGRNHPWIDWQVAETEHFRIIYPRHLEGLELQVAAHAEAAWQSLTQNLGKQAGGKMSLYISDVDEISNGFAAPVGDGYAMIWVNVHDYADSWTGREKWLRKVIAHELAHLYHFRAVKTPLGLLGWGLGTPVPDFWAEGLAQYMTEKWDAQRGDRWLRRAIFDSRPNYNERVSIHDPRLLYASGHSQVRWFAERFGDDALQELMAHRDTLFGVIPRHDFYTAFRQTVDRSYDDFREEWRKHVNVYYNSLASWMERTDSLEADPLELPADFIFDLKQEPDGERLALLGIPSMRRPVRTLYLLEPLESDTLKSDARETEPRFRVSAAAEGGIRGDLTWSPDGSTLAWSRRVRGRNSALLTDIFLLDTHTLGESQLTFSRRASWPAFGPEGRRLAYVVHEGGTGQIVIRELETGREEQITQYRGDVQLIHLVWNHPRNQLVFQRFEADGDRHLVVLDLESGEERLLDTGDLDNRRPLISPDGRRLAFTSLRDEVPNVFMTDLDADSTWRVSAQFTGAEALDWVSGRVWDGETLLIHASELRKREWVYPLSAERVRSEPEPVLNEDYASWRLQTPPNPVPANPASGLELAPEEFEELISQRYRYRPVKNLTHGLTFALPWYTGRQSYGIAAASGWLEPLGKHMVAAAGILSVGTPGNSWGILSYVNNQLWPTLNLSVWRAPVPSRFYGADYLVETMTGGEISARWPLDRFESTWRRSWLESRLRYYHTDPWFIRESEVLEIPAPIPGREMNLRISWMLNRQKPWVQNLLHPLDGYGFQLTLTGADQILGAETRFLRGEAGAYRILQVTGPLALTLSGRLQWQSGEALPQNFIGFSSVDNIQLPLNYGPLNLQDVRADRVRGYRDFIAGHQVGFVSAELRLPMLPSLQTTILGFLRLGQTTLSLFSDAGAVRDITVSERGLEGSDYRLGLGSAVNNIVGVGPLRFVHSVGVAQPWAGLFGRDYDLYYRIRASVPF